MLRLLTRLLEGVVAKYVVSLLISHETFTLDCHKPRRRYLHNGMTLQLKSMTLKQKTVPFLKFKFVSIISLILAKLIKLGESRIFSAT